MMAERPGDHGQYRRQRQPVHLHDPSGARRTPCCRGEDGETTSIEFLERCEGKVMDTSVAVPECAVEIRDNQADRFCHL